MKNDVVSGRTSITSPKRAGSFSRRAMKGKLDIIKPKHKICPHCGHRKFLSTENYIKCAKCKREVKL